MCAAKSYERTFKPAQNTAGFFIFLITLLVFYVFNDEIRAESPELYTVSERESTVIYIGVLANRGADICLLEWGPTADYLSEFFPEYAFRILPLGFDEILEEVSRPDTQISFISANSSYYAFMEHHGLARRIATLQIPGVNGPESSFGGVIFTRANRNDIREISDLKNKRFAAVDSQSLGGWHAALREMLHFGLKPERDFKSLEFKGTHDEVVYSVLSAHVDAGTVRSTQLERMADEGLINLSDLRIINSKAEQFPDYPYYLSTPLYPEWPFAAIIGVNDALSKRLAVALFTMPPDHPAALSIRGAGWTIPQQYEGVHALLQELLLPPYEDYGITLGKIIKAYLPWLLTILVLFLAAVGFGVFVYLLKRKAQGISQRLIKSELKFTKLFDNAPTSIMVMDRLSGEIVDANRNAIESYGLHSLKELQNANIWADPPYSFDDVLQWHRKVMAEGLQRFEWKSVAANGRVFWEEVLVQEVDFGEETRLVAISVDISDRKTAEENLRRSEEVFRSLSENLSVGVAMISKDMQVLTVNPKLLEWFPDGDYSSCPKCYHVFNSPPAHGLCTDCPIAKTLTDGNTYKYNREAATINGLRHFAITATAIRDADGEITAAIEMVDDITERVQNEAIISLARQQADEANKAKSEFLANMSHEIRTPLNGIIGFSELLSNTNLNDSQQLFIENVITSAHSLLAIINDILDLSKIEADKLELEIIKVDVFELAAQAADIIKFHASQKNLELLLNLDPAMPRYAWLDPVRVKQILVNLLSNAVKFTEKGEVALRINYKAIDDQKGEFVFCVRDTGIGISEQHQKRIFEVFMQADSSTTRRYGGSGLGLPISALLTEKMDSQIRVNSRVGIGSEFSFSVKTKFEAGEKLFPGKHNMVKSVLLVDDNISHRHILEGIFTFWDIDFSECGSGIEAIELLREKDKSYDLLIIDQNMPDINGLDTTRIIRQELLLSPELQAIMLMYSSANDPALFNLSKELGINFMISKPLKPHELLQYIEGIKKYTEEAHDELVTRETPLKQLTPESSEPLILLVEDVEMNLLLIKMLISKILPKARFVEAMDGRAAVQAYKANPPDLVFMDIQMPIMDGWEATEAIRAEEEKMKRRVPVIALSARAFHEEIEKCKEAGMDDFLAKPVSYDELTKLIEKYIHAGLNR